MASAVPPVLSSVNTLIKSTSNAVGAALRRGSLPPIIVFSHLRWEFVTQRPQHILCRFATETPIVFIEEPIAVDAANYGTARVFSGRNNVTVIQPRINSTDWDTLQSIVNEVLQDVSDESPLLWFYSPAFVEMARLIEHQLIVFDVMDELSAFKGASRQLLRQEKALLRLADVVFTGGKSLYESKRSRHLNVHCFPSSVDRAHFEQAVDADPSSMPRELRSINGSIAGFYGVIDERIDLQLLAAAAKLLPTIQFVMVGPVVKIDPVSLPQQPNIYYLGAKSYDELPAYLAAFDVAIMPFALNEATQFISPTKTLEFMAALKPIVSTPIYDVVRQYDREVLIAGTARQFAESITKALYETPSERYEREALQRAVLARTSWHSTVQSMRKLIVKALRNQAGEPDDAVAEERTPKVNERLLPNLQLSVG